MSEDNAANMPAPPSAGPSWSTTLLGFAVVLVAGLLAAVLVLQYLHSRPINLRPHTKELAQEVIGIVQRHQVPAGEVAQSGPIPLQDAQSHWNLYRFTVAVPPEVDADGLRRVVKETMTRAHEGQVDAFDNPQENTLSLAFTGRVFAEVRFETSQAAGAPVKRTDLRAACYRLADEFAALLEELGVPEAALADARAAEREDADTLWAFTRYQAALPAGLTLADVEAAVIERMTERAISTVTSTPDQARAVLRIAYAGFDCVALEVPRKDAPARKSGDAPAPANAATSGDEESERAVGLRDVPAQSVLPLEMLEGADDDALLGRPIPPGAAPAQAKVAIILDDGGYGGTLTEAVLALDPGLTLAILPYTPHAAATAELAKAKGFEVMMHMPMETNSDSVAPFPGCVDTGMTAETIAEHTRNALAEVPGAAGVNNHTGSKFTSSKAHMAPFIEVLREKDLYFVDSRTVHTTVAYDMAQRAGVPAAQRALFLDNESNGDYINQQLDALVQYAKKHGAAVGIGHFREGTVNALAQALPELKQEGLTLVHASELVQ